MSEEMVSMRLEVLKGETMGRLRARFQRKVQLEDEMQDNEAKLHWERGFLAGLDEAVKVCTEIRKGADLMALRKQKEAEWQAQGQAPVANGDGHVLYDATLIAKNVPVDKL